MGQFDPRHFLFLAALHLPQHVPQAALHVGPLDRGPFEYASLGSPMVSRSMLSAALWPASVRRGGTHPDLQAPGHRCRGGIHCPRLLLPIAGKSGNTLKHVQDEGDELLSEMKGEKGNFLQLITEQLQQGKLHRPDENLFGRQVRATV